MNISERKLKHPIIETRNRVLSIFSELGFEIAQGPELEEEWYNFDALNVPKDHPARDMQDTFFIKSQPGKVLRTHTTGVTLRSLKKASEENRFPCAFVASGKVFRNEATDATHEMQFFQVDGSMVGADITMSHLKGVLTEFFKRFLGSETKIRFRPSFFPFVEPGVEVDIWFRGRWMEVLGAGMLHRHVLQNAGIDPDQYQGFAFGMGLDRLVMAKYDIPDVRYFYNGDARLHESLK